MISSFSEDLIYTDHNELFATIFALWGSIYGIIKLADNKEKYLNKMTGIKKEDFMRNSFESLFQSIRWKEKS